MKIIIVGLGNVGESLAISLLEEDNDVTVVDLNAEKVKEVTSKYDCLGVVGNGAKYSVLKEAGVSSADLLVAVTESDERNLLCCTVAKKSGKCRVIARIESPDYFSDAEYLKDGLGLAMVINPEQAAAAEIARVLRFPTATKIETFAKGRVELVKFRLPEGCPLVGKSVKDAVQNLRANVLVCTVERGADAYIANGNFVFEERDLISVVASPRAAAAFFKKINYSGESVKDCVIVGAGEITHYLAELMEKDNVRMKVISSSRERCEALAEHYDALTVIHGDVTDQDLLIEEGIARADAFLALSDADEENILLSIFGRESGEGKIITKVDKPEYERLTSSLKLDTVIFPKNITADNIIRYVRSMQATADSNVENLYTVIKGQVEATEFVVGEGSPVLGVALSHLKLKPDCLIAAILRGRSVVIPRGSDSILCGDRVVVVSKLLGIHDISEILS